MARLLTCPQCSARYRVPASAIGASGKTVRCHACGENWFVAAEASTPDALELEDLKAATMEPPEMVDAPAPVGAKAMKADDLADMPEQGLKASGRDVHTPNAAVAMREMSHRKKRGGKLRLIRLIWIATALILALALALAVIFRQPVVERFPATAALYSAVGLQTTQSGLDLGPVTAQQVSIDGEDFLVVTGEAVNLTDDARWAPMLELTLLDGADAPLASWSVDLGATRFAPNERRDYTTEYPNPPLDAKRLSYGFEGQPARDVETDPS